MGMTTYVRAIKPPDERWRKLKEIWHLCKQCGIEPPSEIYDFFKHAEPDEKGIIIDIPYDAQSEWDSEDGNGIEVDLSKIPKDVKILRFINSW